MRTCRPSRGRRAAWSPRPQTAAAAGSCRDHACAPAVARFPTAPFRALAPRTPPGTARGLLAQMFESLDVHCAPAAACARGEHSPSEVREVRHLDRAGPCARDCVSDGPAHARGGRAHAPNEPSTRTPSASLPRFDLCLLLRLLSDLPGDSTTPSPTSEPRDLPRDRPARLLFRRLSFPTASPSVANPESGSIAHPAPRPGSTDALVR